MEAPTRDGAAGGRPAVTSPLTGRDDSQLVRIPAGTFAMGSEDGPAAERPVHRVSVDAFCMARHPVTNAQYRRFVLETGHRVPFLDDPRTSAENWDPATRAYPADRGTHPVVVVSWQDAQAYCSWAGGRLATEAEWERAARGGLERLPYPWGEGIDRTLANYDSPSGTTPVASFPPNAYGLFDMAGNVWEWVADWFDPRYYERAPLRDPTGPETGAVRVLRGGAWLLFAQYCRVSYRFRNSPDFRFNLIGFRLASSV